jgi:TolA-binding protein
MSLTIRLCFLVSIMLVTTAWTQDKSKSKPKAKEAKVAKENSGSNEKALAIYADAANFLNAGAHDLAIEQWNRFLKEYPRDPMAGRASHYLGVSMMQRETPDYETASRAFAQALVVKGFDLQEEALANQGWCLYMYGREQVKDVKKRDQYLNQALQAYASLTKSYPKSKHVGQANFFSAEAYYGMGNREKAIEFYQKTANTQGIEPSVRCDALYGQGIAEEELKRNDAAIATFQKLLDSCKDSPIASEVRIRRGDLLLSMNQSQKAVEDFQKGVALGGDLADYAQYRYAAALIKLGKVEEAGKAYADLLTKFPKSKYAAVAELAAAQAFYQSEKYDQAATLFTKLLQSADDAVAIEGAHWLAQIALLKKNQPADAVSVAEKTLTERKENAPYREALQLDLAEGLAGQNKVSEALAAFAQVHENSKDPGTAARALYGAAFTALQGRAVKESAELANQFLKRFPNDPLRSDVGYVAAESMLLAGNHEQARVAYEKLLQQVKDHPDRRLWVLRSITATHLSGKYDDAAKMAREAIKGVTNGREKAETFFLIGASEFLAGRPQAAIDPLTEATKQSEPWPQAEESLILLGQALAKVGKKNEAKQSWQQGITKYPKSRWADQGRYRTAQMLADEGDLPGAMDMYEGMLTANVDPSLRPYALYGKSWCYMQKQEFEKAMPLLEEVLKSFPDHAVANDAKLAVGICLRKLGKGEAAKEKLQSFLQSKPTGIELGHALYELAQLDLDGKRLDAAAKRLRELADQVPHYPSLDQAMYQLAWTLKESGKEEDAAQQFEQLVSRFPKGTVAAEASYQIGQRHYASSQWAKAASAFQLASQSKDSDLREKSLYKLGWAHFESGKLDQAEEVFQKQLRDFGKGSLALDARMMIGECRFKAAKYSAAIQAYAEAKQFMNGTVSTDAQEQEVRELILLHGGQSAAQQQQWSEALKWFGELREKYPKTKYLPQVFYETGAAYQQLKQPQEALSYFSQVASNYRTEVAARARFMMGEIYFGERDPAKAIPEYQRVMYGYGAEQATPDIKKWQAKSAFEAGRSAELLIQNANGEKRQRTIEISRQFYQYLIEKHSNDELVVKAKERLSVLEKL